MQHLTSRDFIVQPWKNGKGTTVEMWRLERDGDLLVRLSRASVVEDGPFSVFPGIERNLTVLTGAGFRLTGGGIDLRCDPLVPVAFAGDVPVDAVETHGLPSEDFNVMTARTLPRPQVTVEQNTTLPAGGTLALYALGPLRANGVPVAANDLLLADTEVALTGGPVLAVRLAGL